MKVNKEFIIRKVEEEESVESISKKYEKDIVFSKAKKSLSEEIENDLESLKLDINKKNVAEIQKTPLKDHKLDKIEDKNVEENKKKLVLVSVNSKSLKSNKVYDPSKNRPETKNNFSRLKAIKNHLKEKYSKKNEFIFASEPKEEKNKSSKYSIDFGCLLGHRNYNSFQQRKVKNIDVKVNDAKYTINLLNNYNRINGRYIAPKYINSKDNQFQKSVKEFRVDKTDYRKRVESCRELLDNIKKVIKKPGKIKEYKDENMWKPIDISIVLRTQTSRGSVQLHDLGEFYKFLKKYDNISDQFQITMRTLYRPDVVDSILKIYDCISARNPSDYKCELPGRCFHHDPRLVFTSDLYNHEKILGIMCKFGISSILFNIDLSRVTFQEITYLMHYQNSK